MSKLQYNLVKDETDTNLTIYYGGKTYPVHSSHRLWDDILKAVLSDDPKAVELADIGSAVGQRLPLSSRIAYANGTLYLDGDAITDGLATQVVRMVQAGDNVEPFVSLLEAIIQNPSTNSRQQLNSYIDRNHITITQDGMLVLYKLVKKAGSLPEPWADKTYQSCSVGPAIVNGIEFEPKNAQLTGHDGVPQGIGDTVEMPRSKVVDNPSVHCTTGLHAGAWKYVKDGPVRGDVILEVHVHPRDVVSVPSDYSETKIRVCRYIIVGERTAPYDVPVLPASLVKPVALVKSEPKAESKDKVRGITPSPTLFNHHKVIAKAQKKGLKRYLENKGFRQVVPGDQHELVDARKNWVH